MEVFKSKNGIFYKVLEWAECPKHGRYVSRIAEWRSKNEFGLPWSCVCQACWDEAEANRLPSLRAFRARRSRAIRLGPKKLQRLSSFLPTMRRTYLSAYGTGVRSS